MKNKYLYTLLICVLFFGCKHDTTKCVPCPECTKPHVEDVVVTTTTTSKFLALSDVHIDGNLPQTRFEKKGKTDSSVTSDTLWQRTKAKIESVAKAENPKFMVYLGDLPGYDDSERRNNTHLMLQNLRNLEVNVPILYLPGNNDSLEGDYYSFSNDSLNTVLNEDADASNPWPIINSKSSTIQVKNLDDNQKQFGYYSVDLIDGTNTLKVIALNTVIFCAQGNHRYIDSDGVSQQKATQDQMTWLETKLNSLGTNDRVIIMMHIPIGIDGFSGKQMWKNDLEFIDKSGNKQTLYNGFLDLIAAHQTNIVGILNGHTHTDGLRRLYTSDAKSAMTTFSVSTPGIAVNHGNNPSFKTFTYDTTTFDLLDFETYYASPTVHKTYKHSTHLKNTDFKFLDASSYTFQQSYKVSTPTQTIFNTLEKQPKDSLVKFVNSTLGAKSNQNSKLKHPEAVNVYKN
ncbi:metallophosphoesterase [Kordia antarctica]|nr:metallophosphoesterase [Kordia antarctica]